jgi:Flp pilus assembly pilin Flp
LQHSFYFRIALIPARLTSSPKLPITRKEGFNFAEHLDMSHRSGMEDRTKQPYRSFLSDETGQDLVEYTLLAALIGSGVVLAWDYILSSSVSTVFLVVAKLLLSLLSS